MNGDENPFRAEDGEPPRASTLGRSLVQYIVVIAFSVIVPWLFLAVVHYWAR